MPCSLCDAQTVPLSVPASHQAYAPAGTVAVCTECLTMEAAPDAEPGSDLDAALARISDGLPDGTGGVAILLLVDRLASLASNREAIEALIEALETEGVDPLLALDRLSSDDDLAPAIDLPRRRAQLEQLVL